MKKIILAKEQVYEFVNKNKYRVDEQRKFLSRCVDGRYKNALDLPPLAIPGADAGQLSLILATANSYGLELDTTKVISILVEIVGGEKNFNFHTDQHGESKIPASGCGHIKQQNLDFQAYDLDQSQLAYLQKTLSALKKKGAREVVLEGEHQEGAVLQVQGNYSLYPQAQIETSEGAVNLQAFIYQSSLVAARNRLIAKKLIEQSAIKLFPGCDEDYLYAALLEVSDNHVFETLKRLASGLPIYQVTFDEDGSFTVKEMGKVS